MEALTRRKAGGPVSPPGRLLKFDELKGAWLAGAKGPAPGRDRTLRTVGAAERKFGVRVTVVDAAAVCGPAHLAGAVHHARMAAAAGEARARDPQVEVMLYLSGQRQIKNALARAGVGPKTKAFAFVIEGAGARAKAAFAALCKELGLKRDDSALSPSRSKYRRLSGAAAPAGERDLEALAMEHTAMLRLE